MKPHPLLSSTVLFRGFSKIYRSPSYIPVASTNTTRAPSIGMLWHAINNVHTRDSLLPHTICCDVTLCEKDGDWPESDDSLDKLRFNRRFNDYNENLVKWVENK